MFDLSGLEQGIQPRQAVTLTARSPDERTRQLPLLLRIDTPVEMEYYRHGGILPKCVAAAAGGQ
ncbi:hypothetical protein [Chromobacterium vaccinii]|uniref:Uncharacterized protein n=1 Tax=Chromobacterium vaccinii TaxID=1108595 RepID=A0A1D9LKQ9_9NEIS|nr:hypothetical protein [Chromobacterium vaccinii]AOZ51888.1 hypothetical protein BKX93_19065 [Chromobacterium vaccinii]